MLHTENPKVRELLLDGCFGLERESLRVTGDGFLAQTPHPFGDHEHICRDFSENQLEINTPIANSPEEVVAMIERFEDEVQKKLASLPEPEYLWPFSNPPYIRSEKDVPVAQFEGENASKTRYREHLSDRYGRYKMAFSGIHFNYSFSQELLEADFAESGEADFAAYKARFYLELAEMAVAYGWIVNAITAASPMMDSSFVEKGNLGEDLYLGLGTVRCSELGYWNYFAPTFDYRSMEAYANSIQRYIDRELIKYPSELYFPIRVKPRGNYDMDALRAGKVSHIELRMFDLNPLYPSGINADDVFFGQLLLVWLACIPHCTLDKKDQVQAVQNFKSASHYDLKTVKIVTPDGQAVSVARASLGVIDAMEGFFRTMGVPQRVFDCLAFQRQKFIDPDTRYAWKVRELYSDGFVKKGVELARRNQQLHLG